LLLWNAAPGATRYELVADPDGQGPLPEEKIKDYSNSSPSGFSYAQTDTGGFSGSLVNLYVPPSGRLNATYRLRACNASECGPLTDAQAFDITQGTSYEFLSGYSALMTTTDAEREDPKVSRDGLTLAIRGVRTVVNPPVLVFTRSSKTQPWVQQASLTAGDYATFNFSLAPDGNTLVARSMKQISEPQGTRVVTDAVVVYGRSNGVWAQQARLDTANAPAACTPPCQAELAEHMALSANGNVLALSATTAASSGGSPSSSAVFTYVRTGTVWAWQASIDAGGPAIGGMALSGTGDTLAVSTFDPANSATPGSVVMLAQNSNGVWSQQGRVAATLAVHMPPVSGGPQYGKLALSNDGSTLAVNASNLQDPKQCNGAAPANSWGIALYQRTNGAWQSQGQAVIANGQPTGWATWVPWALASDGNAVFYGNTLFTRNNGSWTCP
jgi:hypothetical protein